MENLISKDETFFVAGHNGMVGSSIVKALKKKGYCDYKSGGKLYKTSRKELDLSNYQS